MSLAPGLSFRRLPLALFLTRSRLFALAWLRLSCASALAIPFLALTLRHLLHAIPHSFELGERLFDVRLVAGTFARIALLLHAGLGLLQLVAQLVESHGHCGFAHPGLHSLALPDPLSGFAHAKLEFILLGFGKRIAQFIRDGILRASQAARGFRHLFLELLQLVGHLFFFASHLPSLLLRFSGLLSA